MSELYYIADTYNRYSRLIDAKDRTDEKAYRVSSGYGGSFKGLPLDANLEYIIKNPKLMYIDKTVYDGSYGYVTKLIISKTSPTRTYESIPDAAFFGEMRVQVEFDDTDKKITVASHNITEPRQRWGGGGIIPPQTTTKFVYTKTTKKVAKTSFTDKYDQEMVIGDLAIASDSSGSLYVCKIIRFTPKKVVLKEIVTKSNYQRELMISDRTRVFALGSQASEIVAELILTHS